MKMLTLLGLALTLAWPAAAQNADDYRGGWRTDEGDPHVYEFSIRGDRVRGVYCTRCSDATTLAFDLLHLARRLGTRRVAVSQHIHRAHHAERDALRDPAGQHARTRRAAVWLVARRTDSDRSDRREQLTPTSVPIQQPAIRSLLRDKAGGRIARPEH
jgi:hypothetical protein